MTCFLVGGINRSGTTLVQRIISTDPDVGRALPESMYLRHVAETYASARQNFEKLNSRYFSSIEDMREFTAQWAQGFVERAYRAAGDARHVVLKHPPMTQFFPALAELLEDARFIIVIRNPLDVIASLVRMGEKLREAGDPEGDTLPRDMSTMAAYYASVYGFMARDLPRAFSRKVLTLKYEALVGDPDAAIAFLEKHAGLDLAVARRWQEGRDAPRRERPEAARGAWHSDLWGQPIVASRIGIHRDILEDREIRELREKCAFFLKFFDYS